MAPMQCAEMESMPGLSGDFHPHHLVEQLREEYVLPYPALTFVVGTQNSSWASW